VRLLHNIEINVCQSELFETAKGTALLVKRFDRNAGKRIPYKSAMTLLGVRDGDESNDKSYCDLASVLDSKNKKELFRRMVFNGLFGNTDDHLRNHGVLYDEKTKSWSHSIIRSDTLRNYAVFTRHIILLQN